MQLKQSKWSDGKFHQTRSRMIPTGICGFFLDNITLSCYIYMALEVSLPGGSFLFFYISRCKLMGFVGL
jgi:hypothetical protein